jgi:hypothetical protein
MKFGNIIEEQTTRVRIESPPKKVINLLNAIIAAETDSERKKRAREYKGILIGKYPNIQALQNSIKGIKKKIKAITEAKMTRKQVTLAGIMAALMTVTALLMPSIKAAEKQTVTVAPEKKIESPITGLEARVLTIGVKDSVWNEVERVLKEYLKKLAASEYSGQEARSRLTEILKKHNVNIGPLSPMVLGKYYTETDKIRISWENLLDLVKGRTTLNAIFGVLRHEMTHRAQHNELKKMLDDQELKTFIMSDNARTYIFQVREIGAFHDEFKQNIKTMSENELSNFLDRNKSMVRSIAALYPESDPVVKVLMKMKPDITRRSDNPDIRETYRLARKMIDKYKVLPDIAGSQRKNFEEDMEWKQRVGQHLNESDPQRKEGGYEKRKVIGDIKRRARGASDSDAYEWGTKYKILRGHFS